MKELETSFSAYLAEGYPAGEPTLDLRRRILAGKKPRIARRTLRLAYAGLAIAAVGFGSVFIGPKAMAYATLKRIEGVADALPYWHVSSYTPDANGKLVISAQTWGEGDQIRDDREFGHSVLFTQGDVRVVWRPGEDHAVRNVLQGRRAGGVSKLSGFIQELQASTSLLGLTVDEGVSIDGRQATRVTALSKNEPVRTRIYADPTSQIPFLATIEVQSENGWRLERRCEIDTTRSTISMSVPAGVRVVNQTDLEYETESRYSKPLAVIGSIKLRDVWMNTDGVIFVLYTNGHSFKPIDTSGWKEVKGPDGRMIKQGPAVPMNRLPANADLVGMKVEGQPDYVPLQTFQGAEYFTDGRFVKGLRWPDGDAIVKVFAPIQPTQGPEKVTLQFGSEMWKAPSGFKPTGKWVSLSEMVRTVDAVGTWNMQMTPQPQSVPEWMDQIGIGASGHELLMDIAQARSAAAWVRGDGPEAEAQARTYLRETQLQAAESGNSWAMYPMYEALGKALALEGKTAEARAVLQKALGDAPGNQAEQIRKELNALPADPR